MSEQFVSGNLPVLALRGLAIFPGQSVHFDVGRIKSALALEYAMKHDQMLFLVPQKNIVDDEPDLNGLYMIGTVVRVKQILKSQNENIRVLVSGICRAKITELTQNEPYLAGSVEVVAETPVKDRLHARALCREAAMLYANYSDMVERPAQAVQLKIMASENCGFIADSIAQNSGMDYRDKAKLLCQLNPIRRLETALRLLQQEIQMLNIEVDIQEKTRATIDQEQRDYYLREQMKTIREELGEEDDYAEFARYEKDILELHLDKDSEEKLLKDLLRLKKQPFGSAEASVLRSYLDTVLSLPWNRATKERIDVSAARKILDKDHFGLEKVKTRILETIAVRQIAPQMPPQILCLVGPPGVGKTSVAYSIARSLNRKLGRIALGGVHDEADIRGHRKTYVGAMPGRILTALTQAGSSNALLLLDEVDKMGSDYRGDPSAALLEVLDSEQNVAFVDRYVDMPYDLSDVLFITTANDASAIPAPLYDRMDVIKLGSYTAEEKWHIAKEHLIGKQIKANGLKSAQIRFSDEVIREIIDGYTREAGVRQLEREIGRICRKAACRIVEGKAKRVTVSSAEEFLGTRKFKPDALSHQDEIGVVNGLAWTSAGGEMLPIEVAILDGTGKIELTGSLGDVMKESARIAISYARAHAREWQIERDFYKTKDIHIHAPEGAVPKDGPSAGIAMTTALISALTGIPVRSDVAMTGEISLRGRVLPIGGLREKSMAAYTHRIKTVIIPGENVPDLEEVDAAVKAGLKFAPVARYEEVLALALTRQPDVAVDVIADAAEPIVPPIVESARRPCRDRS